MRDISNRGLRATVPLVDLGVVGMLVVCQMLNNSYRHRSMGGEQIKWSGDLTGAGMKIDLLESFPPIMRKRESHSAGASCDGNVEA